MGVFARNTGDTLVVAFVLVPLLACAQATAPRDLGLRVRVEPDTVIAERTSNGVVITVRQIVLNQGTDTLYGFSCPTAVLQRKVGRDWQLAQSPLCTASVRTLAPIPPGSVHEMTLSFGGTPSSMPSFYRADSVSGWYRLVFAAAYRQLPQSNAEFLPTNASASNEFFVLAPR